MLSRAGGDRECRVTETKEEIERFLVAVEKGEVKEGKGTLESLSRMADKYDCPLLALVLKERAQLKEGKEEQARSVVSFLFASLRS